MEDKAHRLTDEKLDEAIDIANAPYTYEETDISSEDIGE